MTETVAEHKGCISCGKETNGEVLCKDHVIEDLKYHVEELERSISKQEEEIDSLAPRIAELEAQLEWKPIKDAPRDGTKILLFDGDTLSLGFYDRQNRGWWTLSRSCPEEPVRPIKWCAITPPQSKEGGK